MPIKQSKRTRGASTVVQFVPTKKSARLMSDVRDKWPQRLKDSKILFLLDVANFMLEELQSKKPMVEMSGEEHSYAKDLRIGLLEEGDKQDTIAIYLDGAKAEVTAKSARNTVLYFRPNGASPDWVDLLVRYGPWPAEMVPLEVGKNIAKVISRRARPDELEAISSKLYSQQSEIESAFRASGAGTVHVGKTMNGVGLSANEDLGYNAIRKEMGLDGTKKESVWRPVFRDTKVYAELCVEKVVEYVKTGNESIFDLPTKTNNIGMSVIEDGKGFSKAIAPFIK